MRQVDIIHVTEVSPAIGRGTKVFEVRGDIPAVEINNIKCTISISYDKVITAEIVTLDQPPRLVGENRDELATTIETVLVRRIHIGP